MEFSNSTAIPFAKKWRGPEISLPVPKENCFDQLFTPYSKDYIEVCDYGQPLARTRGHPDMASRGISKHDGDEQWPP